MMNFGSVSRGEKRAPILVANAWDVKDYLIIGGACLALGFGISFLLCYIDDRAFERGAKAFHDAEKEALEAIGAIHPGQQYVRDELG